MKVCVYAICKNESKFLDRWLDSVLNEADYVCVLDTGSTDDTYERLCALEYNCAFKENYPYKAKIIANQYNFEKELG